ncbi:unnamed protein product [Polarella glacialis]|uniref:Uncharacterized protein n=1 Tax=Polarella glacialis TaxID=89957 RepID=A0A813IM18_POLGL|nr:unnamed protein product [Polarella glacialis]
MSSAARPSLPLRAGRCRSYSRGQQSAFSARSSEPQELPQHRQANPRQQHQQHHQRQHHQQHQQKQQPQQHSQQQRQHQQSQQQSQELQSQTQLPRTATQAVTELHRAAKGLAASRRGDELCSAAGIEQLLAETLVQEWLPQLSPRQLALSAWSLARLAAMAGGTAEIELCRPSGRLSAALLDRAAELDAQGVSMVLWALAKLSTDESSPLAGRLALEAARRLLEFAAQGLANCLWACATLRMQHDHRPLLSAACESTAAVALVAAGTPQAAVNVAWALTLLASPGGTALEDAAFSAARGRARELKPPEAAALVWAAAAPQEPRGREELGPAELSAVAWSLASARHMGPPWSAALADALIRRSGSLPLRGHRGLPTADGGQRAAGSRRGVISPGSPEEGPATRVYICERSALSPWTLKIQILNQIKMIRQDK